MNRKSKRVLIVDDDYYFREILQQSVEAFGFEVLIASDVTFAQKTIEALLPDLIITDIRMPGESGLNLLKWVKKNHSEIPVVMMTGFTDAANAIAAHQEGAVGFLPKPFRLEEVEYFLSRLNAKGFSEPNDVASANGEAASDSVLKDDIYLKVKCENGFRYVKVANGKAPAEHGLDIESSFSKSLQMVASQLIVMGANENEMADASLIVHEAHKILRANDKTAGLLESLKEVSSEAYENAIRVASLCAMLYPKINRDTDFAPTVLILAALLHDIGKCKLDAAILSRPRNEFSASDRLQVESHAQKGYDLLKELKALPAGALEAIAQHHERLDGSGYPCRLSQEQVNAHALMIGIADEFVNSVGHSENATDCIRKLRRDCAQCFSEVYFQSLEEIFHVPTRALKPEWIERAG